VLDFSWVLAGPHATRLLADFGAEVIKVQPLYSGAQDTYSQGYYNTWNRNKLSITLDPGKDEGLALARKLAAISDVVVENFSPRVMTNWGLDYAAVKKIRPDIIFLSLSMMGHSGPWLNYSGFGPAVQAFSGITRLTSYPDLPPVGIGYSYADHIAALYASLAILGALEFRRRTGQGQYIDLSETEAMTSLLSEAIINYTLTGQAEGTEDSVARRANPKSAPEGIYRCQGSDNWCAITVSGEAQWQGLKRALGNPPEADGPQFATAGSRRKNASVLNDLITGWTTRHTAQDVMAILQRERVPAGVVQNALDLAQDPQLWARGFFNFSSFPLPGEKIADSNPIHLAENPAAYCRPAPAGGQDNDYVFGCLLGLSEDDLRRYRQEKVI
jgi:benzylsuccinate CoA-transferase BbsF subunit